MILEKIKELRIKAESAKALLSLADDDNERKHFKKLLDSYKKELLKFLDEPQQKVKSETQEQKRLGDILADNQANLVADIDSDQEQNSSPLFN